MIRHFLFLTLRNIKKFKNTFFINLTGLATGLACTILIFLWVTDELNKDKFNKEDGLVFQVYEHQKYSEEIMTTTSTPGILAENIKVDYPEIEYAATTTWVGPFTLTYDEKNIEREGFYVGEDFFNVFTYPLLAGDPSSVLKDKNSIVLNESTAKTYFGSIEEAIGKTIEFQHSAVFKVTGVFKDITTQSSEQFEFVLPFEKFKETNEWVTNWGNNGPKTYVKIKENTDYLALNQKIVGYIESKSEGAKIDIFLKPFSERYLYGKYEGGKNVGGRIEYVQLFSLVAIFILVIACINFMNLSTARASRRMKEIGVKKAIGARKSSLVFQFLVESVIVSFLSLMVAMALVYFFLPVFNEITGKTIELVWSLEFVGIYSAICLLTGLLAGSYPAVYLSGFGVVSVLKGNVKGAPGELWVRKGLVVFQFWISILLIVGVIVIYFQIDFMQSKHPGYNRENIVFFEIEGRVEEKLETFLSQLNEVPGIQNASSIGHTLMGQQNNTHGLHWAGKDPEQRTLFENVRINHGMLSLLNVEFKEGRDFSRDFPADTASIIFNEAGIRAMGLEDPIGQKIVLWDEEELTIIGVVKDFNFQSLHEEINPLFMRLRPDNTWYVMAQLTKGNQKETLDKLTEFYSTFNPGFELNAQFLDKEFEQQYIAEQRVSILSRYFAGFAVLISALGLFGLAAFTAERRIKEIGIRKVLGASEWNLIRLLSTEFTKMVLISVVLSLPLSYYFAEIWLTKFAYRINLEIWFFVFSGVFALLIAWITVGFQSIRAAYSNPVDCLRDE